MADTTLSAIIDRVQAVVEAAPLRLTRAKDAFSHDRQPNSLLTNNYHLRDAGISSSVEMTSNCEARIDTIEILIARKLAFEGTRALETMETTLRALERALVADGPSHGYHARLVNRKVTRQNGKDFLIGSATLSFDFDYTKDAA